MEPLKIPLVRCPVFVLDENVSGYASMGSGEFDSDGIERENSDNKRDGKHQFKSSFAQELNENISQNYISETRNERFSKSEFDEILDKTLDFRKAQADFLRVKQENARLRFEIEKHKHEEERYDKMQLEIEHLTSKLSKMEQSSYGYEDASNQLGYFFELFSNQLALSPYGTEMGRTDDTRRRSRTMVSEAATLSSIASLHSRRKSTSCSNTQTRKQKTSHKLRSISTDCASDTSSMSQAVETRSLPRYRNRRAGREEKFRSRSRTLDHKYNRHSIDQEVYDGYDDGNIGDGIDMEDDTEINDIENAVNLKHGQCKTTKKKTRFELILLRLKTFLLKDNKYDLRKHSYKEHTSTLSRTTEAAHKK